MTTLDTDPIVIVEYRIESFAKAIDKVKADIAHNEATKKGLTEKIAEEKAYLTQLRAEVRALKKEAKTLGS